MNSIDGEVETILLPADVEIVNFEGCEEADGFTESQTVITTVDQVDWTNVQLTIEPSETEEYLEEAEEDPLNPIALENDVDDSTLQTDEYATQYVLVEDDGEEIDEDESQQETPFLLFEDGTVKCIDQVLLLQHDDDDEEITTIDGVEYTRTREKRPKSHVCKYEGCGKAYSSPHHLKVHERNHTNDRPYQCTFESCNKRFNTDYSRKAHVRTHTGEKPYVCSFLECGKGFKTSGDLAKHVRTHTGERPFECPLEGCEKSFVTSNACKVHLRTHTGEKPYMCQAEGCKRGFSSPTNFKNHMRIHTGEKPYACSLDGCNKKFTEYSSLYKHRLVHSPLKHYPCNFCSKVYRQISSLSTHKRTVHGVVVSADGSELLLEQIISTLDSSS